MLKRSKIIGSSHGLLCLHSRHDVYEYLELAVIWNIPIRKRVTLVVPVRSRRTCDNVLGFGVCRETMDPKIVHINTQKSMKGILFWRVEVFALSTRVWRSLKRNLPRESIRFGYFKVDIDGILYWLATDRVRVRVRVRVSVNDELRLSNMIISFDITTEEFKEINLPDSLANQPYNNLSMFKLKESLVVLERGVEANEQVFYVWMMEDVALNSFAKRLTINVNTPDATIKGFRKSGEPITEIAIKKFGRKPLFYVHPCMETLLLLGQQTASDSIWYAT
ncbi:F-box/kelch-repeat protein At3g23880-like [Bidens hawaiensis]|uniref:F-box/kelch-repeat protein At3g23880-like n=1 Tax=Bidens hawaiensis TaxID=980011 RepID=UPI00404AC7E2